MLRRASCHPPHEIIALDQLQLAMTNPTTLISSLAVALALVIGGLTRVAAQDGPQAKLTAVELTAGMHAIRAEVATTADEQATGLMFRRGMGANDGMLFVYPNLAVRCFSMRNTWVALTVAFVGNDGSVIGLADMTPMDLSPHCSPEPVRFALEVPQGWFTKRGFRPGLKLRGAPFDKQ
jgi:uncharacterized protein